MLLGRYAADACSRSRWPVRSGGRSHVPASVGTFPTDSVLFGRLLVGVIAHRDRADVFPGARRWDRSWKGCSREPEDVPGGAPGCAAEAAPANDGEEPVMFVVEVGAVLTTILLRHRSVAVRRTDRRVALAHRRCSPTWPRPRPRAAGRRRRRRSVPRAGETMARRLLPDGSEERARAPRCSEDRASWSSRARSSPSDGEIVEGVAVGRRVRDHRRVGAGDPRVGRRPLAPSPAAPRCCRTGSWCGSRRCPARRSSTG